MLPFLQRLMNWSKPMPLFESRRIHIDSDVVRIHIEGQKPIEFRWAEVLEIATYKRDWLTFDEICLSFKLADRVIVASEEMEGWLELVEALPSHFPDIPRDWKREVMFPAFEPKSRMLYKRV